MLFATTSPKRTNGGWRARCVCFLDRMGTEEVGATPAPKLKIRGPDAEANHLWVQVSAKICTALAYACAGWVRHHHKTGTTNLQRGSPDPQQNGHARNQCPSREHDEQTTHESGCDPTHNHTLPGLFTWIGQHFDRLPRGTNICSHVCLFGELADAEPDLGKQLSMTHRRLVCSVLHSSFDSMSVHVRQG